MGVSLSWGSLQRLFSFQTCFSSKWRAPNSWTPQKGKRRSSRSPQQPSLSLGDRKALALHCVHLAIVWGVAGVGGFKLFQHTARDNGREEQRGHGRYPALGCFVLLQAGKQSENLWQFLAAGTCSQSRHSKHEGPETKKLSCGCFAESMSTPCIGYCI